MTTIGTILAKNPDIGLEKTGSETGSMDSAFAIFTAILANMSAQNEETSDQDAGTPELSAEDLFDQIIADDKVSPLIGPADRKDLLQILDNILENPDRISSVIDLNDAYTIFAEMPAAKTSSTGENTDGALLPLDEEDPIAGIAETPTTSPSSAAEKIFAAAAISMPASSPRGSYGQNRNPVQALASIIRKITPPKVQLEGKTDLSTPSSGKHGLVDPNAYGPFPKNSEATAEVVAQLRATLPINSKGKSADGNLSSPSSIDPNAYGPFPKNSAATAEVAAQLRATLPINSKGKSADGNLSSPSSIDPNAYGPFPKNSAATAEVVAQLRLQASSVRGEITGNEDNPALEVPFLKPALFKASSFEMFASAPDHENLFAESQVSGQQAHSARTISTVSAVHASGAAPTMSGGDNSGQFSQHQQPQSLLDTTMGLDQGRDGRLLRLTFSENGWQHRLIRHIHSSIDGGKDQTITVQLQPRTLGRLTLNISVSGNSTSVNIVASSAEAAALLQDQEARLQQAFDQNGLKLSSMQTSTQQGWQQHAQHGNGRNAAPTGAKDTAKEAPTDENSSTKIQVNANNSQINILA